MLCWTKQSAPAVSVWQAGRYDRSVAHFRLTLSAGGELLTHFLHQHQHQHHGGIASFNSAHESSPYATAGTAAGRRGGGGSGSGRGSGASLTILDGLVCGELLVLLTHDGCLRAWSLNSSAPAPASANLQQHASPMPADAPVMRTTWPAMSSGV